MRVVTWNIRFGVEFDTAARELQRIDSLRDADIVLLQEMDEAGTAAIAGMIGAGWVFRSAAAHRTTGRDFGNAILSRWPITDAVEIGLPHRAFVQGQPRSATRATVEVDGLAVSTYSVHTEIRSMRLEKRVEQFVALADDVRAMRAPVVVIGGDFNTVTGRDVLVLGEAMANVGLACVSHGAGPTFRRFKRGFRLDHVFARGLSVRAAGEAREATASDHVPLWTELTIGPRSAPTGHV